MKPATPRTARGAAEHGAAAVEFGIILPVLIAIVFGIIEFGFVFNTQIALTQAAREGIRHEVLGTGEDAEAQAVNAFISLQGETANAALIESCADEVNARLRVESGYAFIFFPFGDLDLRGEAVMRCGG